MTIITPTGITGITSITSTGNTLQFQNPSGADVSVSGLNVTSGTNINVTGIVTASGGFSGNINSTGVSTFSGGVIVAAGSASAPSISPTGDSNTGIFFPDGDTVSIGEGGTEVVRVHSLGRVLVGTANTDIAGAPSNKGAKQFIYTAEGNGEWALQARHDSATGNGLFVRAGNNSTTYTARFTGYDENNVHLNIDGLGRVTMPYQPSFMVYGSTFQVATPEIFLGSTVDHNIGNHFSTTTGLFTAPISGRYLFSFSLSTEDTNSHFVNLNRNGTTYPSNMLNYGVVYQPGTNTQIMNLSANDTVSARRRASGYAVYYAWFAGCLIG
jgi:hypothetical protein